MITSFDKAIVAAIGLAVYLLNTFAGINLGLDEATINGIAAAVTPILVYLVPNKTA